MTHCASCLITNLLSIFLLSLPILIILRVIHAYVPAHNSVRIKKEINSQKLNYTRIFLFYTLCQWWMSKSAAKTSIWKKLIRIQTWIQVTIISSRFIDLLNELKIFFWKKEARSDRIKEVFTMVYRVTHSQVFKTMAQHKTLGCMTFN